MRDRTCVLRATLVCPIRSDRASLQPPLGEMDVSAENPPLELCASAVTRVASTGCSHRDSVVALAITWVHIVKSQVHSVTEPRPRSLFEGMLARSPAFHVHEHCKI